MWETMGSGNVLDSGEILALEQAAPPGKVRLTLDLAASIGADAVTWLQSELVAAGVPGAKVYTGSPQLNIEWIKEEEGVGQISIVWWVPVILALVLALAIVIIGWLFAKEAPIPFSLMMVAIGFVATAAIVYMIKEPTG